MPEPIRYQDITCPIVLCQQLLAGKWKIVLLYMLSQQTYRFNEIQRLLQGITAATLNKQLKELVDAGLVQRKSYEEIPPRVEYSLTETGAAFSHVLASMHEFGTFYQQASNQSKSSKRKRKTP